MKTPEIAILSATLAHRAPHIAAHISAHTAAIATAWMEEISKLGDFSGVESLYPDLPHILYCNAGDSYASTLIFNHQTEQVRIGCIGDILERRRPCSSQY